MHKYEILINYGILDITIKNVIIIDISFQFNMIKIIT